MDRKWYLEYVSIDKFTAAKEAIPLEAATEDEAIEEAKTKWAEISNMYGWGGRHPFRDGGPYVICRIVL